MCDFCRGGIFFDQEYIKLSYTSCDASFCDSFQCLSQENNIEKVHFWNFIN